MSVGGTRVTISLVLSALQSCPRWGGLGVRENMNGKSRGHEGNSRGHPRGEGGARLEIGVTYRGGGQLKCISGK